MSDVHLVRVREPSFWTLLTWPMYGRENQSAAVSAVALIATIIWSTCIIREHPRLALALDGIAILSYFCIGALALIGEVMAYLNEEELDDE